MTAIPRTPLAPLVGCLAGVLIAGTFLLASRPASGGRAAGAAVSVYANQTGELAVAPAGPLNFLNAPELGPGSSASGSFKITNQTGRPEAIRPVVVPSARDLDNTLRVEIASAGGTISSGPLGDMEAGPGDPLVLGSGDSTRVAVTVSLPTHAARDVAAALVEVAIVFQIGAPQTNGGIAP